MYLLWFLGAKGYLVESKVSALSFTYVLKKKRRMKFQNLLLHKRDDIDLEILNSRS
jgi:hypothetical protein